MKKIKNGGTCAALSHEILFYLHARGPHGAGQVARCGFKIQVCMQQQQLMARGARGGAGARREGPEAGLSACKGQGAWGRGGAERSAVSTTRGGRRKLIKQHRFHAVLVK